MSVLRLYDYTKLLIGTDIQRILFVSRQKRSFVEFLMCYVKLYK